VGIALAAAHLNAVHTMAEIVDTTNAIASQFSKKTWPTAARVKLSIGVE
jgi:hypothetical protein